MECWQSSETRRGNDDDDDDDETDYPPVDSLVLFIPPDSEPMFQPVAVYYDMFLPPLFFLSISSHRETNFSLIFCHLRHGCTCGSGEMVKDWANMTSHYRLIIFGFILCSFPLRPVNVCSEGDHERETFKDRKKKTERGILGNSKRESACLEQLPKTRALGEGGSCKPGAEQELGRPPHSCILGQPDSTSLYSSSTAKDFHLQL